MSSDRGWSEERRREYETLVREFHEQGRYKGREEEVAARIVNKQRAQYGETEAAQEADERGESPDRVLPIEDYDELTIPEIAPQLDDLSDRELEVVAEYEREHKDRKGVLEEVERELEG
jgi:hypothetical protein